VVKKESKKRKLSEIAEERRASYNPQSEWTDQYGAADQVGIPVHRWKRWAIQRLVPPARRDTRPYQWKRSDISAWMELRRLDLWGDWKALCQEHKEMPAWGVMLKRLEKAQAEIEARAQAVRS
jgi:hypothetical protein